MTITVTTTHAFYSFAIRTHISMLPNGSCVHNIIT